MQEYLKWTRLLNNIIQQAMIFKREDLATEIMGLKSELISDFHANDKITISQKLEKIILVK